MVEQPMRATTGRMTLFVLLFALAACVAASSGQASNRVQFGIQDDAWLEFGPGTLEQRLTTLERLGVPLVRFSLRWNQAAPRRPKDATSPRDRAYDWRRSDKILRGLRRHGLDARAHARRDACVGERRSRAELRAAATARLPPFRDRRRAALPVDSLLADLERAEQAALAQADEGVHLRPAPAQSRVRGDPRRAAATRRVGGGATGPKAAAGGVSPVTWVRGMAAAGAKLDAYAHHPYPSTPAETPSSGGCKNCPWITMATIRKLLILVKRHFGQKAIWLTEYGYQTNPPDTFLGVTLKRQATNLSLAAMRAWRLPRVTMLIQYLYRDEPQLSRFQTGLVFVTTAGSRRCRRSGCPSRRWGGAGCRRSSGVRSATDDPDGRRTGWRCSARTCGSPSDVPG